MNNQKVKLIINDNVYEVTETYLKTVLSVASAKFQKEDAIIAVQKGNNVEMRKDVYKDKAEMFRAISKLETLGFKAFYTKAGELNWQVSKRFPRGS